MKKSNEYALRFPNFAETPKAVIAAIAMSLARMIEEDNADRACRRIRDEWDMLYENGIVPQRRPRDGGGPVDGHDNEEA